MNENPPTADRHAILSVVVPCFNEEAVIRQAYQRLSEVMKRTALPYEIIYVDDGSRDSTLEILRELQAGDENVRVVSFSRNFGHQVAVTAGIDCTTGYAVVLIDADLQDPPEVILQMLKKWREGYQVIYGKRELRDGESARWCPEAVSATSSCQRTQLPTAYCILPPRIRPQSMSCTVCRSRVAPGPHVGPAPAKEC